MENCLFQYGGAVDESGISKASTSALGVWRQALAAVSNKNIESLTVACQRAAARAHQSFTSDLESSR